MTVVSNASPLIILAKLGLFDLPRTLFSHLIIARQVWQEVVVDGAGLPGARETEQAATTGWLAVRPLVDASLFTAWRSQYALGAGELATILLARELTADVALIDERRARLLAATEGVMALGTLGLLELAFRRGALLDLRSAYQLLLQRGARIDRLILNQSLAALQLSPT